MPIFSVCFNHLVKKRHIFSAVSRNKITVYECMPGTSIKMLRVYMEPDKEEVFNTVTWGFDGQGGPILAAGGVKGVVRIIYCNHPTMNSSKSFTGHSKLVNWIFFFKHLNQIFFYQKSSRSYQRHKVSSHPSQYSLFMQQRS